VTIAEVQAPREPKYYTVKRHLLERIATLPAGSVVPTERELASELSTSRTTVRQALVELVAEGRLVRRQGAGTFIADPKITWPLHLTSFTEQAEANGFVASTTLLAAERVRAEGEVAARLDLAEGAGVFRIERLRLADDRPMAVETSHLSAARFPQLTRHIRRQQSLYTVLRETYGVVPVRAEELIATAPASPREATLLGTDPGSPMLVLGRHSRAASGEPVEWVTSWYRGDRVTFIADLSAPRP
jgi:GntR family transcriptional regulator